jgi:hypothetical protein
LLASQKIEELRKALEALVGKELQVDMNLGLLSKDRHHSNHNRILVQLESLHHRFSGNRLSLLGPQNEIEFALDLVEHIEIKESEILIQKEWSVADTIYALYKITW